MVIPPARQRPQLDRDTILDAALRLAAEGTQPVSVRMLGAELGADPTAIYRHFSDKDALFAAAIDRLIGMVNASLPPEAGWRQRLRVAAESTLDVMLAHPALGSFVSTLTTGGENELLAVELTLGAFGEAGLDEVDTLRYYGMFSSYVLSFASAQASFVVSNGRERSEESLSWVADYSTVDEQRYPTVAAMKEGLNGLLDRDVYLTGVEIILESAAQPRRRSSLRVSCEQLVQVLQSNTCTAPC